MAKSSGLGAALWVDEWILSNDIQQATIGGGNASLDVTGIDKRAMERIGGIRDGTMDLTAFFNDTAGQAHPVLSALPTTDTIITYANGATVGTAAASMIAKQVGYDPSRGTDGAFLFNVQAVASQQGIIWGVLGTPGVTTETAVGSQASIDNLGASTLGLRAFIHVTAFTGTNATIVVSESNDNFVGDDDPIASFASITGVGSEAISVAGAIERYLRVTITVDNMTTMDFSVVVAREG